MTNDPTTDVNVDAKTPRFPSRRLCTMASALLLCTAWLLAHHPPFPLATDLADVTPWFNLIALGGLPWLFQWAGVFAVVVAIARYRLEIRPTRAAALISVLVGVTWWGCVSWRFAGMAALDVLAELVKIELQSQFGAASVFDEVVFGFIGPIVNPIQLHGPINLQGANFWRVGLSTALVSSYVTIAVGAIARRAESKGVGGVFVAVLLLSPIFIPPFLRLAIRIASMPAISP